MLIQILKIHILSLSIFSLFRLVLLFSNQEYWGDSTMEILESLLMGIRFDNVINCYILALPTLIWMILVYGIKKNSPIINKILYYYISVLFTISYMVSGFDIPYFNQFFTRLDKGAFQWIDSPMFIIEMVVKDFKLWGYFIPFLIFLSIFHFLLRKIFQGIHKISPTNFSISLRVALPILVLFITFLGIRGRIERKSPIRIGTAYFCNNSFLNKIGLNPNFTLLHSLLQKEKVWKNLMSPSESYSLTKKDLDIPHSLETIEHSVSPDSINLGKPNIVVILMEAMTANNLAYFGNKQNLTPVLDGLIPKSIFFRNAYSAGIHTFNGVYSTLFSFPALWDEHPMKTIINYKGSVETLKENGYITSYFTTHDGQFDNIEGFLKGNNFEHIFRQADYPSAEVHSNLGVSDDYLFRYSLNKINEFHKTGKPFFCSMMTASNHAPIIIPEYFKSDLKDENLKAIQYADWSIGQFLKSAEKEEWFQNTIFVLVADHGASYDKTYDMSLSYNHIPIFFYAPYLLKNTEVRDDFIQQIDVLPSILGLTDIQYTKNNMGINIWKQKRPFAYFGADDKIGVINEDFFLIYHKNGKENLYKYRNKDLTDYASSQQELISRMKKYAFSHIQTTYETKKKLK